MAPAEGARAPTYQILHRISGCLLLTTICENMMQQKKKNVGAYRQYNLKL